MKKQLAYDVNGQFKIVQFTDLHWGSGNSNDRRTSELMKRVLAEEKPDLAVVTGDLIESRTCADPLMSIRQAVAPMEEAGVPWAAVFGNHDAEGNVTREELFGALGGCRHGLMERGPDSLSGYGNYKLLVAGRDGLPHRALFFLDSGDYADPRIEGYAWIARDQIDWFARESGSPAGDGRPLPALVFFHIPLPEYEAAWETGACVGSKHEAVCCPKLNSGMFAAMVENGHMDGVFVGHDHVNDFRGELHGVSLCYGRKTGYNNYGREDFPKGARIILLTENMPGFQSWLRLDDGTVCPG